MKAATERIKNELRAELLPLAAACPVDGCNPKDCPLYLLRKMNPAQQLAWFNALGEDDLICLTTYHHVCMATKLPSKPAPPGGS